LSFFLGGGGKRPRTGKSSKFCSKSFHRYTGRSTVWKFCEFGRQEMGKIVRYLPDKKIFLPGSPALATVKICQGKPPTMYSECSRFHPNQFTFGWVIPECVNTIKMRHKLNPIFSVSLASSRIKTWAWTAEYFSHKYVQEIMHWLCTIVLPQYHNVVNFTRKWKKLKKMQKYCFKELKIFL